MLFKRDKTPTPVRRLLILLVILAITPTLALAIILTLRLHHRQLELSQQQIRNTTLSVAMAVDEKLKAATKFGNFLASGIGVQDNVSDIQRTLERFSGKGPDWTHARVVDGTGSVIAQFSSQKPTRGAEEIFLTFPTKSGKIELGFSTATLTSYLMSQPLGEGWRIAVINEAGVIVARSHNPEAFVGNLATPRLRKKILAGATGFFEDVTKEGIESLGYLYRLKNGSLSIVTGAPRSELLAPLYHNLSFILIFGSFFLGVALILSIRIAKKISVPLSELSARASGTGLDSYPEALRTGLSEVNKVSMYLDESERKIREKEDLFQMIVNSMPQIVWLREPRTNETLLNDAWREYTGQSRTEPGKGWNFVHPEDLKASQEILTRAEEKGEAYEFEHRLLRKSDGLYRWHLVRSIPIKNSGGRVTHWIGTATDIDDQKRWGLALEVLAEASEIFSSTLSVDEILTAVAEIFVPKLGDWCAIDLQTPEGIRRVTLVHPDPAMKGKAEELIREYPPNPDDSLGAPNVIRTGKSEFYPDIPDEVLRVASRDQRHFELLKAFGFRSAVVIPISSRQRTLGALTLIYSDPSRRYRIDELPYFEDLGRRAGSAMENALLYESATKAILVRDEFLSIASHELKTPVTTLRLQLQIAEKMLEKEFSEETRTRLSRSLSTGLRQTGRLTGLVDELLDVSRISAGKLELHPEMTNLRDLLEEVSERFSTEERLRFGKIDDAEIKCDRARIDQVMTNLLTNALKYGDDKPVEVSLLRKESEVHFEVKDQGIGIHREKLPMIFERFERAVESGQFSGLGLGLYISRTIVEAHGGKITVTSEPGVGSTFTVIIPYHS